MAEIGHLGRSGNEHELPEEGVRELWDSEVPPPPSFPAYPPVHMREPISRPNFKQTLTASWAEAVGCGLTLGESWGIPVTEQRLLLPPSFSREQSSSLRPSLFASEDSS